MSENHKSIYSLLIGFNEFQGKVRNLEGCIDDSQRMNDFFKAYALSNSYIYKPILINDPEKARRDNIIASFDHFKAAKKDDICIFYYSGHGSTIKAPAELAHLEADGMMETILCYDSRGDSQDLTDKEIGQLIYDATTENGQDKGAHFLAIFDSCHSGNVTRSADQGEVSSKMTSANDKAIPLKSLYGHERFIAMANGLANPQMGTHYNLSACKASEVAYEKTIGDSKKGVFTTALLEVLNNEHLESLTYARLLHQVSNRVYVSKSQTQTPQYDYYPKKDHVEGYFLGNPAPNPLNNYAVYNVINKAWYLNLGAIKGLKRGMTVKIQKELGKTEDIMVLEASPGRARLRMGDDFDKDKVYFMVGQIPIDNLLMVGIKDRDRNEEDQKLLDNLESFLRIEKEDEINYYQFVNKGEKAPFYCDVEDQNLIFFPANSIRAAFPRLLFSDKVNEKGENYSLIDFKSKVNHIAEWNNVWNLHNNNTSTNFLDLEKEFDIEFKRFTTNQHDEVIDTEVLDYKKSKPVFKYQYDEIDDDWVKEPKFGLSIKRNPNGKYRGPLFVSVLYLDERYGIENSLLEMFESKVDDTQEIPLVDGMMTEFGATFPNEIRAWGETEITNMVKILVSTEKFDSNKLTQASLEVDSLITLKGLNLNKSKYDWAALNIPFTIQRPLSGQSINEGEERAIESIKIQAPNGFKASQLRISSSQAADGSKDAAQLPILNMPGFLSNFDMMPGAKSDLFYDVLELNGVEGGDQVSSGNPIKISLNDPLPEEEALFPLGFDVESGLYFPLGIPNSNTGVNIEQLPDPESEEGSKGLGKSIRIFLKRIVRTKYAGKKPIYPILDYVEEVKEGEEEVNVAKLSDEARAKRLEILKDKVKNANRIVVIVHGIIGDSTDKKWLVSRLDKRVEAGDEKFADKYDLTLTYDYESLGVSIKDHGKELKEKLEAVGASKAAGKKVYLVAHSMGGLVCRWMLEKEGGHALINYFIQVGSPNAGSPVANITYLARLALGYGLNFVKIPDVINGVLNILDVFGVDIGSEVQTFDTTLQELKTNSDVVKALKEETAAAIPYTIIPGDASDLDEEKKKRLFKLVQRAKDGLFSTLFSGDKNDLVVSVGSMKTVPSSDNVSITDAARCNHFAYFTSDSGLEQIGQVLRELD